MKKAPAKKKKAARKRSSFHNNLGAKTEIRKGRFQRPFLLCGKETTSCGCSE
jgi:hypothetical protein